jgi:hypothetical protein
MAMVQTKLAALRAGSRPEQTAQAKQAVAGAQGSLNLTKAKRASQQEVFQDGFIQHATPNQAQNQHDVAFAQMLSAQQNQQLLQSGPLASDIAAAEADVQQAQASGPTPR